MESIATSKKTGSSSESSGSSSDSEIEGPGEFTANVIFHISMFQKKKYQIYMFIFPGMIKQQKKKNQSAKEGKKMHCHVQTGPAQATHQSQAVGLQSSGQMKQQQHHHQPSPAGFMAPPVATLESSQLLETSFDSLPPFGQPIMHMSHHTGNSSPSPVPPHLNAHSAGPVSPETHPFLNQHSVLPSPGKA